MEPKFRETKQDNVISIEIIFGECWTTHIKDILQSKKSFFNAKIRDDGFNNFSFAVLLYDL